MRRSGWETASGIVGSGNGTISRPVHLVRARLRIATRGVA
jgi:hypothetical protein